MVTNQDSVLVGLDPHAEAPELDWAAEEAMARGSALQIACVYPHAQQIWPWERSDERMITNDLRDAAHRRLTSGHDYVRANWPDLPVEGKLICGYPADVLTELSASAGLTVVGSHHRTLIGRAFLDSVSSALAAAAAGPLVVVRRGEPVPTQGGEVVAGVDGFGRTEDVLAFAFDYATRHGHPLRAVYCWRNGYGPAPRAPRPPVPDRARRWLHALLEPWAEKYPEVEVRETVNDAEPIAGLDTAARGQALLVVGGRTSNHPRLATLLGSVAQGVVHHAPVPVAVIHPRLAPSTEPAVATAAAES
jgi:nucleotide-binding universal stress UspA family protein